MYGGNSKLARAYLDACERTDYTRASADVSVYGPDFKVECPTGSEKHSLKWQKIGRRLSSIFLLDGSGKRPVCG